MLFSRIISRNCFFCLIILLCFMNSHSKLVFAEEESPGAAQVTSVNKNVDYPGNYEDIGGDFKKPGAFFHKLKNFGHLGFIHGFVAAVSVIIVSELGDKTFFIAAIMAMRHPRITVFLGAMSALTVMTILSACLGFATTVIPRTYTHYISTALFAIFGLKMLKEGYSMSPDEGQEEYEEVQKTLSKQENEHAKKVFLLLPYFPATADMLEKIEEHQHAGKTRIDRHAGIYEYDGKVDVETGMVKTSRTKALKRKLMIFVSRIFLEAFTMTFLAEWGDRSQLTTIILAAREDAIGVTLGAVIGHGICTTLAVIGGRIIAQRISVRSVTFIGGIVFLIFAVWALAAGPGS